VEVGVDGPMVKRGRKPSQWRMRRFTIALSLHPVVDAPLIAALEATPPGKRSALVREWLRGGCVTPSPGPASDDDKPDLEDLGFVL